MAESARVVQVGAEAWGVESSINPTPPTLSPSDEGGQSGRGLRGSGVGLG